MRHVRRLGADIFVLAAAAQRRPPSVDAAAARRCWDECDATTVSVRSLQYMRTKQKVASGKAIYRLAGIDVYGTPQKAFHVARSMQLPPAPPPVVSACCTVVD